jgi:hypothetical protein
MCHRSTLEVVALLITGKATTNTGSGDINNLTSGKNIRL